MPYYVLPHINALWRVLRSSYAITYHKRLARYIIHHSLCYTISLCTRKLERGVHVGALTTVHVCTFVCSKYQTITYLLDTAAQAGPTLEQRLPTTRPHRCAGRKTRHAH